MSQALSLSGLLSDPELNSNDTSRPPTMKLDVDRDAALDHRAGVDEPEKRPGAGALNFGLRSGMSGAIVIDAAPAPDARPLQRAGGRAALLGRDIGAVDGERCRLRLAAQGQRLDGEADVRLRAAGREKRVADLGGLLEPPQRRDPTAAG